MTSPLAPASFAHAEEDTHFRGLESAADGALGPQGRKVGNAVISADIQAVRNTPRRAGVPVLTPLWNTARELGYASILYGLRLRGQFPSRLLASPSDIWMGDPAIGARMQQGLFQYQGHEASGSIPDFTDPDLPLPLRRWLHSFSWLRDLSTLEDVRKARAIAKPALEEWLVHYSRWDKVAWAPDITGIRLMALINHAPLVLATKDLVYRSQVLNAFARQGRHLARTLDMAAPGLPRLRAATGLVFSSILLPGGESRMKPGLAMLERELGKTLLDDGVPESRNPEDLVAVLQLLISLRDAYRAARKTPPTFLQIHIDKAAAALRGLTLEGSGLVALNGARHGQERLVQHCLDMSESQAAAQQSARYGGYQRLEAGTSALVMDTGIAPRGRLSIAAHAGGLAFEFCSDGMPIIVNCGAVCPGKDCGVPKDALRATAAHSTMVLSDTNAARIKPAGEIGRAAKNVTTGRDSDTQSVIAHSDAYAQRLGYTMARFLQLNADGTALFGRDSVRHVAGKVPRAGKAKQLDIRFHLHPDVDVNATGDGALLRLNNGSWWHFRCKDADLSVEPSVYVTTAAQKAVPTQQIVLSVPIEAAEQEVSWALENGQAAR